MKGAFERILIDYFERREKEMTDEEKGIIKAALINYTIAIQDDLTKNEHTTEEVQKAFRVWKQTKALIKKFSK